ncbi:diaphanous 3 [Fistulifera solaris]|uniref:Diaphanous 3 n=1 Tax=Fistulifera solaris TaxID=1519565 RepID=A0A1Z5KKL8_FISSO|nr:diaphanous 3 [Fistulifera solaris]|eukprot:GAX26829.1 diaphanous 3 [Fistulifera solaris]
MSMFAEKASQSGRGKSLSSQAADRMRRRRDMAFIRYGSSSEQTKQNPARTREHAKRIAMQINDVSSPMSIQSTSTFADFGSAFANFSQPKTTATSRRNFFADTADPFHNLCDDSFHSASSSSFFGDDAFGNASGDPFPSNMRTPQKNTTARQNTPSIQEEVEYKFDAFGTNWPSKKESPSFTTLPANSSMQAKFAHNNTAQSTPERSPVESGGAAARRRMRTQMRSTRQPEDSSSSMEMSPQTLRHARKPTDRVSNYSVQHRHTYTSANRSVNSSESGSDVFDNRQTNGGFTFDAFGLDAEQINQEVSDAINDLAISEHSFFDNSHGWDSPSRSSTPNPSEDGFADIRVNNYHSHAIHVRHSPTSTERSSLTDDLAENPSVNLFKEKAGFHRSPGKNYPNIRPDHSGEGEGFRGRLQRQFTAQRANKSTLPQFNQSMKRTTVSMHAVEDMRGSKSVSSPRSNQDVEFYDSDERASEASEEINPLSDAGVAPHLVTINKFDTRKKDAISDNLTESTSATTLEEKKDDEQIRQAQTSRTEHTEGVRWEENQPKGSNQTGQMYINHGASNRPYANLRRSPSPPKKTWPPSSQSDHGSPRRPHYDNHQNSVGPSSYDRSENYSQGNSMEESSAKPSWMIERERIFSSREKVSNFTQHTERNNQGTTRSEGGVSATHSHLQSVLSRIGNPPLSNSNSEVSASPPAFLGVQLKMALNETTPDDNSSEVNPEGLEERAETIDRVQHQEERKMTYAERRKLEVEQAKQQAAKMAEEASNSRENSGKMSYKEKRELELRKQQQDDARREDIQSKEMDVEALIKKRIAANRKSLKTNDHDKSAISVPNYRDVLKPTTNNGHKNDNSLKLTDDMKHQSNSTEHSPPRLVHQPHNERIPLSRGADGQSKPSGFSPSRTMESDDQGFGTSGTSNYSSEIQVALSSSPARNKLQIDTESSPTRKTNLVIETESSIKRSKEEPNAALSHMLMLQQLQQRGLSSNSEASPTRPSSQTNGRGESGEDQTRNNKAHTPKATMMMLNAFLAGKESVASPRSAVPEEVPDEVKNPVQPPTLNGLPALKDDPQYTRFFKMLKLGMPMEVVKHAMTREGLDPSVMDGDHNKPAGIPLKLDPTYSKYFRMLSIGLPMEAVKHAMARDGLDPSVMDQDHDLPVTAVQKPAKDVEKEQDSHRRARLHWNPLRKVTRNSLWAKIDQEDNIQIDIDEKEFQELFQVEKIAETAAKTTKQENVKRSATVRVIDPKRANNGGIVLARLKMSHDEMADAVDRIDEYAMNAEQIENMIEYLPTKNERKALETYMLEGGQDAAEKFDGLCECEKFMVSMMTVKHAKRKVRALLFKLQFETFVRDIQKEAFLVEAACDELTNSVRLRQLLGIILEFGNRLNTAGSGSYQKAGAFTIDSLLKLKQAKAFDKKTTFLEYVIRIVNRNNELLLRFEDDIPTVFKADKVSWEQCVGDLEEVENQLENVRRMALYQARHTHAYGLKKKSTKDDDESLSDAEEEFSLEEEVEALKSTQVGMFTLSAIKYISALRDKIEETKFKFSSLLEYFGEENKNKQPHEIFSTFVKFCRDFEQAKEHVFSEEKKKQREERKRQANRVGAPQERKPPAFYQGHAQSTNHTSTPMKSSPPRNPSSMVRASDHQPSVSQAMAYSSARTVEVSPQRPQHYGRSDRYREPQYTESREYNHLSHQESYQQQDSPANSYETESSPYPNETLPPESPPAIEPSLSQHSNSSSHMAAMRAKARMRRQRNAKR